MYSADSQEPRSRRCYVPQPGSKWQPEEDAKLIELLTNGVSWREISQALPGRSESSCYKHYHSTLVKQLWDDPNSEEIMKLYARYEFSVLKNNQGC